jgi:hypothetical protein
MIAVETQDELKVLTDKKMNKNYSFCCRHRPDLGIAICMSICAGFTVCMIVLLILNIQEFSK